MYHRLMVWFRNKLKTVEEMRTAITPMVSQWNAFRPGSRYEVSEEDDQFVARAWFGSELLVEVRKDTELEAYEYLGRGVINASHKTLRELLAPSSSG